MNSQKTDPIKLAAEEIAAGRIIPIPGCPGLYKSAINNETCSSCEGTGCVVSNAGIGEALRAARVAAELSLRVIGKRMGISHAFLSDLERGFRYWNEDKIERFLRAIKGA